MRTSRGRLEAATPVEPVATRTVSFSKKARRKVSEVKRRPLGRIPRVTRLLALAHHIDGMIHSGELRDWAEAARLAGVTRARMTQITNLLLLAPAVQEALLSLPLVIKGSDPITERQFRKVAAEVDWSEQRIKGEARNIATRTLLVSRGN